MDWATFLKDNSQSIFTLAGVFLGSVITFLISYLNNRFQAIERDKDRREQRRETRTQLELELVRKDIKMIEDSIDNMLRAMDIVYRLSIERDSGKLSGDALEARVQSVMLDDKSKLSQLAEMDTVSEMLAYSISNEFYAEYRNFDRLCMRYYESLLDLGEEDLNLFFKLTSQAAKLHNMLRDKVISIRHS